MNAEMANTINAIIKVAELLLVPFVGYVVLTLTQLNTTIKDLTVEIAVVRVSLLGSEGQGGLIQRVTILESRKNEIR